MLLGSQYIDGLLLEPDQLYELQCPFVMLGLVSVPKEQLSVILIIYQIGKT